MERPGGSSSTPMAKRDMITMIMDTLPMFYYEKMVVMQSYPARALARRLQVDWARDPRKGPRVLMSLRVDFEPMG